MTVSTADHRESPPPSAPAQADRVAARAAAPLVRIEAVSKAFASTTGPITALDDVSLDIGRNEFFTLLGPSGCGKTTLLRLLAGFEHADRGIVRLDGKDVAGDPPNRRPVNIVFQSYALFPHMSVAKNVAFGLEQLGRPRREIADRVAAMLALVRLEAVATRKPAQLSGGQQQRVALARALAPDPKLLLLDEPLSALDLKLRRGMQIELKRIQRETGITFLLVTHDQEEALSMSDRIAVMNEGRIEQIDAPREMHERPRSRFVADFFGANVLPGALFELATPHVAFRPERIEIAGHHDIASGLRGRVTEKNYLGATTVLTVALDGGQTIKVESPDAAGITPGDSIGCRVPPAALVPLDA